MNTIREISFDATVTEYIPEQGKDYTFTRVVTLLVHSDQQTLTLKSVEASELDG
jgi:hypothetical protein